MGVAQPFFIAGLPRSRTAWLSVLCTTDRTVCYHEPTALMQSLDSLDQIYDSRYYSHVGVSDSGLGFFAEEILKRWAPRTLIVERNVREVEQSLAQLGLPVTNYCDLLLEHLRHVKAHPLVMWVPFEALSEERTVERIFWHLLPGVAFDEARFDLLERMVIEPNPQMVVNAFVANADAIMGMMSHLRGQFALKEQDAQTIH